MVMSAVVSHRRLFLACMRLEGKRISIHVVSCVHSFLDHVHVRVLEGQTNPYMYTSRSLPSDKTRRNKEVSELRNAHNMDKRTSPVYMDPSCAAEGVVAL